MVRKLKHHEQKLLRKVDFTSYPGDKEHRGATIIRRYSLSNPNDYTSYNRLAGQLRQLAHRIALLPAESAFRRKQEDLLLEKLHDMGLLGIGGNGKGKLSDVERKITVSAFCRRRLGVVMTRLRMAENVTAANRFVEQGHVRAGTEVVTDPAFLVTRSLEDFVTWVDSSKIKRGIMKYRDQLDDFDLL
ncbi:U3 small nucleolar ribonucleoprotein imp3 [Polychaeton citri CBS 116435]|uniref:U3 small nucleolar ribonucleoprotein protein IMP3 n=1 Tax=Polychaeton citri CBS 116435 TaxID=1314669 RepID=A0A9P4QA57_9PEZI|nr:U3 small nucleolar ribonucleoprotein imp3 [Polychaeton citri CBS 116435]